MAMNNKYLKVDNISFSYDEKEKVLSNVNFAIDKDDILVILGASGDGKTTLLKIIAGTIVEDEGDVYLLGQSLKKIITSKRNFSYLFQEVNLYTHLSIYENMMIGFKKAKLSFEEKDRRLKLMLQRLKISKFVNLKPKFLSLGQQQKVALGKCLLANASLYLFDEPFSALDPLSRNNLLEILKEEKQYVDVPFIYVTHESKDAYKIATKVLILSKGTVLQFDTLDNVINDPTNLEVTNFIGERMNKLIVTLNNRQIVLDQKVINLNIESVLPNDIIMTIPIENFEVIKTPTDNCFKGTFVKSSIDKNGLNYLEVEFNDQYITIPYKTLPLFDKGEEILFTINFDKYFIFDKENHNRIK